MEKRVGVGWVALCLMVVGLGGGCVGEDAATGDARPEEAWAPEEEGPPSAEEPRLPVAGTLPTSRESPATEAPPPSSPPPEPPPPAPPPPPKGFPPPPTRFEYPPLQTRVEDYRVTVAPEALAKMLGTRTDEVFPAEFTGPDGTARQANIRLRGNSSRGWPKKSYRVEFGAGVRFDGRNKLNLVSSWREQTLMLEKLGYDMLQAMGVPASRARYIRLTLNGQYQGIYLDLERVDKSFLRNHGFADDDASIWRCGMKNCEMKTFADGSYQEDWEKQTNEQKPSPELEDFMRFINYTPEPEFARKLGERFELEHHLRTLVMDALIANATVEDSRSYVIHDAVTRRWSYVPWDLNNTDAKYPIGASSKADFKHPLFNHSLFDGYVAVEYRKRAEDEPGRWKPIFSNLNTRIVLRPELRTRILDLTEQAMRELFAPSIIHARIDATYQLLAPHQPGSPYDSAEQFHDGPRYLKQFVDNRTGFLRAEVKKWREWKPGLVLNGVDPREGWVELKNLGSAPVDTLGLVLTTELRVTQAAPAQVLPSHILAPGETLRVLLPLAPEGEVGLFNGQSVVGVIDALYYGKLPPGRRYWRGVANPLEWEVR
ncbi:CotH kinase family protein [Myxococcus sp. RHSTA-1-4]|uniref:CotH kinase family protein n=1 Tax=Myxococcus sp. RHSTA-1-4 TaxID=2874601 RepID=UPI001CBB823A|nr:CotH kinase family protein [Myxococcus sp. RHSTA-1-4]